MKTIKILFAPALLLALSACSAEAQQVVKGTAITPMAQSASCAGSVCPGKQNTVDMPFFAQVQGPGKVALSLDSSTQSLVTGLGTPADGVYAGSGSASLISIAKGIFANGGSGGGGGGGVVTQGPAGSSAWLFALPANAANATNQGTEISSLATLITNTTGLATSSAQTTAQTSLNSLVTNTSGIATSALQATANTSLASINTSNTAIATGIGAPADTAWVSGSGSVIAILKTISGNGGGGGGGGGTVTQGPAGSSPWLFALPTGASTSALQTTANTSLASLVTNTTGLATAANQNTAQTALAAIVSSTAASSTAALQTTGNTSLASLVTNTTGLATSSNQSTANGSLATIATNTTGSATSALQTTGNTSLASLVTSRGTIADSAYAGSGSATEISILKGLYVTTNAAATPTVIQGAAGASAWLFALPTGASTSALQTTANTSLSSLVTNTTGLATASNQGTANTSLASIVTNTAAGATSSLQSTGNGSLATIATASGSPADTAWVSGSGSQIAMLKAIANNTSVSFSGVATAANQTSQLTQETTTATQSTTTATQSTATAAATGTQADTAYPGTGSGSIISLLKSVSVNTSSLVTGRLGSLGQSAGASSGAISSTNLTFEGASVNTGTTGGYLMVFNATAKPANGVTATGSSLTSGALVKCIHAPPNSTTSMAYGTHGITFSVGITAAFSTGTSCATFTTSPSGDFITLDTHS